MSLSRRASLVPIPESDSAQPSSLTLKPIDRKPSLVRRNSLKVDETKPLLEKSHSRKTTFEGELRNLREEAAKKANFVNSSASEATPLVIPSNPVSDTVNEDPPVLFRSSFRRTSEPTRRSLESEPTRRSLESEPTQRSLESEPSSQPTSIVEASMPRRTSKLKTSDSGPTQMVTSRPISEIAPTTSPAMAPEPKGDKTYSPDGKKPETPSLFAPIRSGSKKLRYWRSCTYMIHFACLMIYPLALAWTGAFLSMLWIILFSIMDLILIVDCFVHANTTVRDRYGKIQSNRRYLAHDYFIVRRGWWDLVTGIPLELLAFIPPPLTALGHVPIVFETGMDTDVLFYQFKLCASIRAFKLFLRLPYRQFLKDEIPGIAIPISRLIKTMVVLMIMGHIDACLFWYLDNLLPNAGKRWIDKYLLTDPITFSSTYSTVGVGTQYLISYLTALRSLVLKLREARLDAENVYVIFEFIAGILVYGAVFGNIHSIVDMLDDSAIVNEADERHKFEMAWLKGYMKEKNIPRPLQEMVLSHKEIQWRKNKGMDEARLFDEVPKPVLQEIKNFLYLDLLRKVPLFLEADYGFLNALTMKMRPLVVLDGWSVFKKGDEGDEMYFIRSGTVKMMDEGKLLPPGSFFGEIAIFEDSQRTFTALAAGQVELCVLKREDFNQVMQLHPISANLINGAIKKKKEAEAKAKAEAEMKERMEHIAINMSKKGNPLLERRLPMALGSMRSLAAAASNTSLAIKNGTMKRLFKQNQEGRKD